MTSELDQSLPGPAFQPAEPAPDRPFVDASGTPPVIVPPTRGGASPRTRLITNAVLALAFIVLVGGVAFAVGRATAPASQTAALGNGDAFSRNGFPGGTGQFPAGGPADGDGAGRFGLGDGSLSVQGQVTAIDGSSMTVQLADGTSLTVAIDTDTDYHRQADASASDVTTGSTVIVGVRGLRPDDGGTTATDVTVVP